jgi:hypothetical protein
MAAALAADVVRLLIEKWYRSRKLTKLVAANCSSGGV